MYYYNSAQWYEQFLTGRSTISDFDLALALYLELSVYHRSACCFYIFKKNLLHSFTCWLAVADGIGP